MLLGIKFYPRLAYHKNPRIKLKSFFALSNEKIHESNLNLMILFYLMKILWIRRERRPRRSVNKRFVREAEPYGYS